MFMESVNNGRAKVDINGRDFKIIIPSKKHYFAMILLSVWLVMWVLGEITGIAMVGITNDTVIQEETSHLALSGVTLFQGAWLVGWTIGGIFAILTLLWNLVGQEVIESNYDSITVAKRIFVFQRAKTYAKHDVKNLRYIGDKLGNNIWNTNRKRYFNNSIAFDYGMKTIEFGDKLDEAEARYLIDEVMRIY